MAVLGKRRRCGASESRGSAGVQGARKLESEGKADRAAGKIQNAIGGLADTVRDAAKKV